MLFATSLSSSLPNSYLQKIFFLKIITYIICKVINMTNWTIVYQAKMEYGWNFSIGTEMMVKSGLEKIFLKFLHVQAIFYKNEFIS